MEQDQVNMMNYGLFEEVLILMLEFKVFDLVEDALFEKSNLTVQ